MKNERRTDNPEMVICDDCHRSYQVGGDYKALCMVTDLAERLDPGSTVPEGECVECGAFVHRVNVDVAKLQEVLTDKHGIDHNDVGFLSVEEAMFEQADDRGAWINLRVYANGADMIKARNDEKQGGPEPCPCTR